MPLRSQEPYNLQTPGRETVTWAHGFEVLDALPDLCHAFGIGFMATYEMRDYRGENNVWHHGRGASESIEVVVGAEEGSDGVGRLNADLARGDIGVGEGKLYKGTKNSENCKVVVQAVGVSKG